MNIQILILAWLASAAFGCGPPPPTSPLPSVRYLSGSKMPTTAVLFMPGRRSRAEDFASEGFVEVAQESKLNLELIALDAHLGYYLDSNYKTLPQRIHQDVVVPAMARGIRKFWLVGTSLGALGSLAYAKRFPDNVAGVVLLGPYLGEDAILNEIESAGGLAAWSPTKSVGYEYEIHTWTWLKSYLDPSVRHPIEIFLAFGRKDSYARASLLLAPALPVGQVLIDANGAHDWSTWFELWKRLLHCCGQRMAHSPALGEIE